MRESLLDQEVISITWRRCQHDDNGYDPVLEQTGSRRVERPIASPDLGKGQHAFTTQLLNNCTTSLVSTSTTQHSRTTNVLRP